MKKKNQYKMKTKHLITMMTIPVSRTDRPVSFNQFFFCAGA